MDMLHDQEIFVISLIAYKKNFLKSFFFQKGFSSDNDLGTK